MNILLFLTPKQEVTLLYDDYTIGQALRAIEAGGHHAVPIIRRSGEYVGTITEGDLLWYLQKSGLSFAEVEKLPLNLVPHSRDNQPLLASMDLTHLLENSMVQNFAPVVDDRGMFIGIITRKRVLSHLCQEMK
ncbi:MAG: CBS domain-containing protein, partial [Clostridia bacterium]|nr:CBS domain-containing protein [Clostridia bacterium]